MKLVELLARDLESWADTTVCYVQDPCGKVWPCMETAFRDQNSWCGDHGLIDQSDAAAYFEKAATCEDHDSAIVTREQWDFERNKISQPQAEEVEVTNEKILKPAIDALENMTAQWEQSSGPLAWRDTIIHCQAIIEDCERDIQRNVDLLDAEGLMMQTDSKKAMQAYAPDVDMSDWRNWKVGDVVECLTDSYGGVYTKGQQYKVKSVNRDDFDVFDNYGETSSCRWYDSDCDGLKFVSRP